MLTAGRDVWFSLFETLFFSHGLHTDAPACGWYHPLGQGTQKELDDPPEELW